MRLLILALMILGLCVPAYSEQIPEAQYLLGEFARGQDSITRLKLKYEAEEFSDIDYNLSQFAGLSADAVGRHTRYYAGEVLVDGARRSVTIHKWTDPETTMREKQEEDARYRRFTFDGRDLYCRTRNAASSDHAGPGRLSIMEDVEERGYAHMKEGIFEGAFRGGFLFGYQVFGLKRIDTVLLEAGAPIRLKPDTIRGISCYLMEADTQYGKCRAWVAPSKGYCILKMEAHSRAGDTSGRGKPYPEGYKSDVTYDTLEIREVDGVWFPTEGVAKSSLVNPGVIHKQDIEYHVWLSDIALNPEFSPTAFGNNDLLNGARVSKNMSGVEYRWQDGQAVLEMDYNE